MAQQLCYLSEREEQATGKGSSLLTLLRYLDEKVLTRCSGWTNIEEPFPSFRKRNLWFLEQGTMWFLSFYYREPSQMLDIIPPSIPIPYDSCGFSMTFFFSWHFWKNRSFLTLNLVTISMIYNSGLNSSFWEWACLKSYDLTLLWLPDFDSYNLLWV